MNTQLTTLTISYPNFQLDTIISPVEMNQNFLDVKNKVNDIIEQVNLRADVEYVDGVAADFSIGIISDGSIEKDKLSAALTSEIDAILPTAKDYADGKYDGHVGGTSVHGATSLATAGRIALRDANGRIKAAAPSEASDVAIKATVDAVQTKLNSHTGASAPHSGHAAKSHSHSNYSLTTHNHSGVYAAKSHSHSNYSPTTHTHSAYASTSHNHSGTYEPVLAADRKRKITISTSNPSGGSNGDIWIKY